MNDSGLDEDYDNINEMSDDVNRVGRSETTTSTHSGWGGGGKGTGKLSLGSGE